MNQPLSTLLSLRPRLRGTGSGYSQYFACSLKQLKPSAIVNGMYRLHCWYLRLPILRCVLLDPSQRQHRVHQVDSRVALSTGFFQNSISRRHLTALGTTLSVPDNDIGILRASNSIIFACVKSFS